MRYNWKHFWFRCTNCHHERSYGGYFTPNYEFRWNRLWILLGSILAGFWMGWVTIKLFLI